MTDFDRLHWDQVYTEKSADEVSWFQPVPAASLAALERLRASTSHSLIDIGGGASSLAGELIVRGWEDLSVLDISSAALNVSKKRLGDLAGRIDWIASDVTRWSPRRTYDIWHDRAVFHFLTEPQARAAYRRALLEGVAQGGLVIIATFAADGPEKCSGLPVQRYDADSLGNELGSALQLIEDWREVHVTPWGSEQPFTWCAFRRR